MAALGRKGRGVGCARRGSGRSRRSIVVPDDIATRVDAVGLALQHPGDAHQAAWDIHREEVAILQPKAVRVARSIVVNPDDDSVSIDACGYRTCGTGHIDRDEGKVARLIHRGLRSGLSGLWVAVMILH
jgi:hypothetical protein